jgi:hypothetical protein
MFLKNVLDCAYTESHQILTAVRKVHLCHTAKHCHHIHLMQFDSYIGNRIPIAIEVLGSLE